MEGGGEEKSKFRQNRNGGKKVPVPFSLAFLKRKNLIRKHPGIESRYKISNCTDVQSYKVLLFTRYTTVPTVGTGAPVGTS